VLECVSTVMRMKPPGAVESDTALVTRYTLQGRRTQPTRPLLVVEDNAVNQKVMLGFLAKLGYQADVASNGREALDALERTEYPLVLMDSQMPVLDGFATTAEIRRREASRPRTIIVAVTAHAMTGERERCLAAGMNDYLSKPVSLERLAAILDRWIPAASGDAGSPSGADSPSSPTNPGMPQSTASSDALDRSVLAQLRELETDVPGLVGDVVTTFLRETPARLDRLRAALAAGDAQEVERAAHSLKGSAGSIGARRLGELAADIEGRSRVLDLDWCRTSIARLDAEFVEVQHQLIAES
jgi:CheY-like chemotaxis protein/HPt (histidine-containing phosphotransfer) domain-containing protein